MRMLRFTLWLLLALLVAAVIAIATYVTRTAPTLDGQVKASGLGAPAQVRRDPSDVTHIEAQSVADAYFALGYVHAQERSWQLEFNRRVMHGELSELFGAATLDTDRLLRRLGLVRAAQKQWEGLPQDAKDLLSAYARCIIS